MLVKLCYIFPLGEKSKLISLYIFHWWPSVIIRFLVYVNQKWYLELSGSFCIHVCVFQILPSLMISDLLSHCFWILVLSKIAYLVSPVHTLWGVSYAQLDLKPLLPVNGSLNPFWGPILEAQLDVHLVIVPAAGQAQQWGLLPPRGLYPVKTFCSSLLTFCITDHRN